MSQHRFFPRLRRALRFARPHRAAIGAILLVTLGAAAANAAEPLILKGIVDALADGDGRRALWTGVGLLVAILVGREGATALTSWLTWRTRLRVHQSLLEATVSRIHRLPVEVHREEGVGALMTKLDRGIQGFVGAITEVAFNLAPAIGYLALAVVVMVQLDVRLAAVVLAFTPLPAVIAAAAAPHQIRRERTLLDRWARIYSRFNEVLSGIVTVRSFAMEDAEKQRFLRDVESANGVVVRGVGTDSGIAAAQGLVTGVARVSALAFGGLLVLRGDVTVGTLVAFLGYVGGLFGPVQSLSGSYKTLQTASVSLDTVFGILDAQDTLGDAPGAVDVGPVRGEVVLDRVTFGYRPDAPPLLRDIDLHVRPGEMVAIVGPSGAGKTTLMALLMRFYDPTSGAVRLDGKDLRSLKQRSVRRQIGVVLQDAVLFNDTVRNNIAYGRPGASFEDIVAAARAANAHDFVSRLPKGYDTKVGERGSLLSAGERQRVSIARAILKDAPIQVLDEATSSLDAESEALVQDALERLMHGRTTFVIAHRLATVVHAHRILVLRDGRIHEQGTHAELLAKGGYYADLVHRQTRGLLARRAA